jgi:hypothetical protein
MKTGVVAVVVPLPAVLPPEKKSNCYSSTGTNTESYRAA